MRQNAADHFQPAAHEMKEQEVSTTFDKVADIIADTSEIERESITPESHTIDDLGIDSLDFLDIVFADRQGIRHQDPARTVDAGRQ
jgi:hypothetical protein